MILTSIGLAAAAAGLVAFVLACVGVLPDKGHEGPESISDWY